MQTHTDTALDALTEAALNYQDTISNPAVTATRMVLIADTLTREMMNTSATYGVLVDAHTIHRLTAASVQLSTDRQSAAHTLRHMLGAQYEV